MRVAKYPQSLAVATAKCISVYHSNGATKRHCPYFRASHASASISPVLTRLAATLIASLIAPADCAGYAAARGLNVAPTFIIARVNSSATMKSGRPWDPGRESESANPPCSLEVPASIFRIFAISFAHL
jgi:hypothetical protein